MKFKFTARKLLVIDAFGAAYSAVMLGLVLVAFEAFFGIPPHVLYVLAAIPLTLMLFDVYALLQPFDFQMFALRRIAWLNRSYILLSLALVGMHASDVQLLGWVYILIEALVVWGLSSIQLRHVE